MKRIISILVSTVLMGQMAFAQNTVGDELSKQIKSIVSTADSDDVKDLKLKEMQRFVDKLSPEHKIEAVDLALTELNRAIDRNMGTNPFPLIIGGTLVGVALCVGFTREGGRMRQLGFYAGVAAVGLSTVFVNHLLRKNADEAIDNLRELITTLETLRASLQNQIEATALQQ